MTPSTPGPANGSHAQAQQSTPGPVHAAEEGGPEITLMNPAALLPFSLPTSTDMLVTYGAGFGGVNRERARRYIPTIPPDFFNKLDPTGQGTGKDELYKGAELANDEAEDGQEDEQ